jgi:hypothetical protein
VRAPRRPKQNGSEVAAGCVAGIALSIPLGIYRAWVLMLLWGWYVVPLGAPDIGMAHAYGLSLIALLCTMTREPERNETIAEGLFHAAFFGTWTTTFALVIGWALS